MFILTQEKRRTEIYLELVFVLLSDEVGEGHVGFALPPNVAGQGIRFVGIGVEAGVGIDGPDVDLDGPAGREIFFSKDVRFILGFYEAIRPRTLPRNVEVHQFAFVVLREGVTLTMQRRDGPAWCSRRHC